MYTINMKDTLINTKEITQIAVILNALFKDVIPRFSHFISSGEMAGLIRILYSSLSNVLV